jgi:hypothetical protein
MIHIYPDGSEIIETACKTNRILQVVRAIAKGIEGL